MHQYTAFWCTECSCFALLLLAILLLRLLLWWAALLLLEAARRLLQCEGVAGAAADCWDAVAFASCLYEVKRVVEYAHDVFLGNVCSSQGIQQALVSDMPNELEAAPGFTTFCCRAWMQAESEAASREQKHVAFQISAPCTGIHGYAMLAAMQHRQCRGSKLVI